MMNRTNIAVWLTAVMALTLLMVAGCGGDGDDGDDEITNGVTIDCVAAGAILTEANDSLGALLFKYVDTTLEVADSSFRPADLDFSGVNTLYNNALAMCPSSNQAKFGAGLTGLLTFLGDPTLDDLIDRFKQVYDTSSFNPFNPTKLLPGIGIGSQMFPRSIPLEPSGMRVIFPSFTELDKAAMVTASHDPMISEIQILVESSLLPRLEAASTYLAEIADDTEFAFTFTPEMQGNLGADNIIFDRSDVRVMLATAYAAEAGLHIFLARDLDLAAYTASDAQEAVRQGSSFSNLKANGVGAAHMSTALARILSAEAQAELAVDNLLAEIGTDQTNDFIAVYPDDQQDLNDIKDSLQYYRTYFDGPKELKITWTDSWNWCTDGVNWWQCDIVKDSIVEVVDVAKFFTNPWQNPKAMLPGYTVTIDALDDLYKSFAAAHFDSATYWDSLTSLYGTTDSAQLADAIATYNGGATYVQLPTVGSDEFYRLLAEHPTSGLYVLGWDDLRNPCVGCENRNLSVWGSRNMWEYRSLWWNPDLLELCYSWTDNSFAEWTWPDPTFNGLLPNMTDTRLKELILDDGSRWKKSECDTTSIN